MNMLYDVIIIGAGPAGLAAALYTSRLRLSTLVIEKETIGGGLMNRDMIENYPGYPDGILGPDLGEKMSTQVLNYGTRIQLGEVKQVKNEGNYKLVKTFQGDYVGKSLIIAGGAYPKKLGIPGEQEFIGKGVFYCGTCDGPRFTNKRIAIVGGGDSGITEALFLTRIASRICIIERLPKLTATKILQEKGFSHPKIEIKCGNQIEAINGNNQAMILALINIETREKSTIQVEGVLIHAGVEANTEYLKDILPLDEKGQILVDEKMQTKIPGILAAGDIRQNSPMQIATAVGDGVIAALSSKKYLENS